MTVVEWGSKTGGTPGRRFLAHSGRGEGDGDRDIMLRFAKAEGALKAWFVRGFIRYGPRDGGAAGAPSLRLAFDAWAAHGRLPAINGPQ